MRRRFFRLPDRWPGLWVAVASAAAVLLVIGGLAAYAPADEAVGTQATTTTTTAPATNDAPAEDAPTTPRTFASPRDAHAAVADGVSLATGGSPPPDITGAVAGDGGGVRLPLGEVTAVPDSVQVDFLFEFCWGPCFRDGHFMDPGGSGLGSGPFTSDTPFHVRHGFVNETGEALGDGFDVVIYITALDQPGEFGGEGIAQTYRYTSDYVLQGESEACGPTYRTQEGPVTCEWFVHEFPDGLPEGRHALWAIWEAPCSAWVDYGFTDSCADPAEVMSLFSSGFDSPFGPFPPDYTEPSDANLTEAERQARMEEYGFSGEEEDETG